MCIYNQYMSISFMAISAVLCCIFAYLSIILFIYIIEYKFEFIFIIIIIILKKKKNISFLKKMSESSIFLFKSNEIKNE